MTTPPTIPAWITQPGTPLERVRAMNAPYDRETAARQALEAFDAKCAEVTKLLAEFDALKTFYDHKQLDAEAECERLRKHTKKVALDCYKQGFSVGQEADESYREVCAREYVEEILKI